MGTPCLLCHVELQCESKQTLPSLSYSSQSTLSLQGERDTRSLPKHHLLGKTPLPGPNNTLTPEILAYNIYIYQLAKCLLFYQDNKCEVELYIHLAASPLEWRLSDARNKTAPCVHLAQCRAHGYGQQIQDSKIN